MSQALLRNPLLTDKMAEDLWKKEYDFAVEVARKAGAVRESCLLKKVS